MAEHLIGFSMYCDSGKKNGYFVWDKESNLFNSFTYTLLHIKLSRQHDNKTAIKSERLHIL
jgi:hypothetical protein